MESIDLELGDLFDRDAIDADDEGEDVGAHAGHGDEAADDGVEGWCQCSVVSQQYRKDNLDSHNTGLRLTLRLGLALVLG